MEATYCFNCSLKLGSSGRFLLVLAVPICSVTKFTWVAIFAFCLFSADRGPRQRVETRRASGVPHSFLADSVNRLGTGTGVCSCSSPSPSRLNLEPPSEEDLRWLYGVGQGAAIIIYIAIVATVRLLRARRAGVAWIESLQYSSFAVGDSVFTQGIIF